MPCRVDLMPVYSYYDWRDRADYLFFRTPLAPLLCEAMKVIGVNNLTEELSPEFREAMIKWKEYHDRDDAESKKLNPYENKETMDYFSDFEKNILTSDKH